MSRFTVGQEITPKETTSLLTRGRFYTIAGIDGSAAFVYNNKREVHWVSDYYGLTHEEYEQAEREKDPFAPGKWVVCVKDDYPARVGDFCQVTEPSKSNAMFRVSYGNRTDDYMPYYKSHFRPATPEEIKEQEMKTADENRQTFTVGGQEFYVGQTVWAKKDGCSFTASEELEVIGPVNNASLSLCVRKLSSSMIYFIGHAAITTTEPKPHEWKFGDWVRDKWGNLGMVISKEHSAGTVYFLRKGDVSAKLTEASTLTYISTAEIPE